MHLLFESKGLIHRGLIMKIRFLSLAAISVLLINSLAFATANMQGTKDGKNGSTAKVLSILPDSDGIAVIDSRRALDDALPKVLSANQPMLTEVTAKLKAMETRTGIDLRKFNQVAVGVAFKQVSPSEVDYDTVAAATGDINAQSVLSAAKAAAKSPVREEKAGSRTIYIFTEQPPQSTGGPATSKAAAAIEKLVTGFGKKEVAVAAFDSNTLVIGSIGRVRQTLTATSKPDSEVRGLLPVRDSAVVTFAARTNGMLGKLLPLDADMLGESLNSIQYVSGFMDVATGLATVQVIARTKKPEQAADLKTTLEGLQMVGKAFLRKPDQQIYVRMIENARFTTRGADLTFDLTIPQADIDILVSGLK
jgi:hypothetical protein